MNPADWPDAATPPLSQGLTAVAFRSWHAKMNKLQSTPHCANGILSLSHVTFVGSFGCSTRSQQVQCSAELSMDIRLRGIVGINDGM